MAEFDYGGDIGELIRKAEEYYQDAQSNTNWVDTAKLSRNYDMLQAIYHQHLALLKMLYPLLGDQE